MKFARFCQALSNWAGSSKTFLLAIVLIGVWGDHRAVLPLQRHVATHHQHVDDHHHVPDGISYPKYAKPRQ